MVSVRNLAGLGVNATGGVSSGRFLRHIRRLPPHGLSPRRSCPRLVLSFELFIWYHDSIKEIGTKYRGLSPHKITPMLGVLRRVADGHVFKLMVTRGDRVIADVTT